MFIQNNLFCMIFRVFHFLVYFTILCDKPKVMYKLVDKHYVLTYLLTCLLIYVSIGYAPDKIKYCSPYEQLPFFTITLLLV